MADEGVRVDCEAGRRMGCASFCCRLLVRLDPDERPPAPPGQVAKGLVDKTPEGRCVHFDADSSLCAIWDDRPRVCRRYDCNPDPRLQVVLHHGFHSLVQLATTPPPKDAPPLRVPYVDEGASDGSSQPARRPPCAADGTDPRPPTDR